VKVVLTDAAMADLVAIGEFIQADNPERAASFVDNLLDHCQSLSEMPDRHSLVPRFERHGIRHCVHGNYLICYRVSAGLVEIVHILHGAPDYEPLLFTDP
jgi:toxin ParE1/3/4